MTYHNWGEEGFDFRGVEVAAYFIGDWLIRWARLPVFQMKEKYGTARVYCCFGWSCFYSIWRPHYCRVVKWWPYKLDLTISQYLMPLINKLIIPVQKKAYRWRYKQAIKKWPGLRNEILSGADYHELLEGL